MRGAVRPFLTTDAFAVALEVYYELSQHSHEFI